MAGRNDGKADRSSPFRPLDFIPHAVVVLRGSKILFANRWTYLVFDWQPDELVGQPLKALCRSEEDCRGLLQELRAWDDSLDVVREGLPCRQKSGKTLICRVSASFLPKEGRQRLQMLTFDEVTGSAPPDSATVRLSLSQAKEALRKRVRQRTLELQETNRTLRGEIAERKKAEKALRKSERLLADIIEFLPDPTFVVDAKRQIVAWNRAIEDLTGVPGKQMVGKGNYEYAIPFYGTRRPILLDLVFENRHEIEEEYRILERRERVVLGEACFTMTNGRTVCLWGKAAPILDHDGKVIGAIECIRDVTEKKQGEEALRRSEDRFSKAFLSSPTPTLLTVLSEDTILDANESFCRWLGYSPTELIGRTCRDLPLWANAQDQAVFIGDLRERGSLRNEYSRVLTRKGEVRDILVSAEILPTGGEDSVLWLIRDITEHRQAAKALREREKLFRTLTENTPIGIALLSADRRFEYFNPHFTQLFGYTLMDLPDEDSWFAAVYPDPVYRAERLREWREHFHSRDPHGTARQRTLTLRCRDGSEKTVQSHSVSTEDGRILITFRDVTEQRRLEAQLRQSQKMEAIGTLAGGIAHDFNNILAPILGYTEMALNEIPEGSRLHRNLSLVRAASHRAKDLVKQILAFGRQSEKELKPLRIHLVVKEAMVLLRATLPSTIEIRHEVVLDGEPEMVMADPTQVHQVMINLCTNAAHAMRDKGGTLGVRLVRVTLASPLETHYTQIPPGSYVKLTVSDTGHGIPPEDLHRVFEPYFTTKAPGEGTGMGLAVVYGIVSNHGGGITVESEPGRGSAFHVFFPVVPPAKPKTEAPVPGTIPSGSGRILFVDDEPMLVGLGQYALRQFGYETVALSDSREALALFREDPHRFDLVVSDYTMPHMTGTELAVEMLRMRPDIPIVLCTGFSASITEEQAKELGIRSFLLKPVSPVLLAQTISALLVEKERGK